MSAINNDFSMCDKIKSIPTKDWCWKKAAEHNNDSTYCQKVQDIDEKDICYMYMAQELKDEKICDLISYDDTIEGENHYKGKASIGNAIFGREECIYNLMQIKNDPKICFNLVNRYGTKQSECVFWYVKYTNDKKACDIINNSYWKESCDKL
jgi:hypothetical protein